MRYAGPPATPEASGESLPGVTQPWTVPLGLLALLWVLVLFEPDVWLASKGVLWARKIPLALYLLLVAFLVPRAMALPRRVWLRPFLLYIVAGSISIPFAEDTGLALGLVWKTLALYYCLGVATLAFVRSVEKTRLLLLLFLGQFAFWGVQALASEATLDRTTWQPIPWHPLLGNTDGFAPLMVIGMVFSYYSGVATQARRMRWLAFLTGFLCVIGVVAAFTRGASLAAGLMVLYVLLRSTNKRKALIWIGVVSVVFLIATNVIYPAGEFWARLATITSEGTRAGTGGDRWDLWRLGLRVFTDHPIFGVGAGNFGAYAFYNIAPGELLGKYALNHWLIYGRVLHSVHMEILVEFGLVGFATYIWMLLDFWKRNVALRSQRLAVPWARVTRGRLDLRNISLGLEGAMIAFLITGFFYDQLFVHWLYSLVIVNALLHATAQRIARAAHTSLGAVTG